MCDVTQCKKIQFWKMAPFRELFLLIIFFWLCLRRLRLDRARLRRRAAAQSVGHAIVVSQWRLISHVAITSALRLLKGNRLERRLWVKPRSASFFQDIVPGWSEADFKGNYHVSRATFTYLVNELQLALERQDFLRSSIPVDQRIAIALWRLRTNIEYKSISHLFGVGLSSACVIVHQVCKAIVDVLGPQYRKLPQGEGWQAVVDGFRQRWQFPQWAGAMDGSNIPIIAPPVHAKDYFNRKCFHSIVLQGVVDHQCKIMDVYIGWPGSVHDARVLANSNVFAKAEAETLFPDNRLRICGQDVPLLMQ